MNSTNAGRGWGRPESTKDAGAYGGHDMTRFTPGDTPSPRRAQQKLSTMSPQRGRGGVTAYGKDMIFTTNQTVDVERLIRRANSTSPNVTKLRGDMYTLIASICRRPDNPPALTVQQRASLSPVSGPANMNQAGIAGPIRRLSKSSMWFAS